MFHRITKSAAFLLLFLIGAFAHAEPLVISGLRVGAPSEASSAAEGGVKGTLGYIQLRLDYKKRINYYFSASISFDLLQNSDERDIAREVEDLPSGANYDVDSAAYGAFLFSGGVTYNANTFDNLIFFAGPALSIGNTLVRSSSGSYFDVEDNRFGVMGGVVFAFEKLFLAADYTTNINSLALTIGYEF